MLPIEVMAPNQPSGRDTYNVKTPKMHKKLSHTFPIIFHILQPLTRNLPPLGNKE